jgi:hypothetical protein
MAVETQDLSTTEQTAETGAAAASAATTQEAGPGSMLDAIFPPEKQGEAGAEAAQGAAEGAGTAEGTDEAAESARIAAEAADPAAKKVADDAARAKADADALKPPQGVGPEAQKRFQHLANMVKERDEVVAKATEQVKQLGTQIETFRTVMREHGVTAQDFEALVGFNRAMRAGDWRTAEQWLTAQLKQVSIAQGKPAAAVDPLSDFPDLSQAVAEQKITTEHALELARSRLAQRATQATQQRQQATQRTQAVQRQAVEAGIAAVDRWSADMAAKDLDWPAKQKALVEQMDWLAENVPPEKWVGHIDKFYRLMRVPAADAAASAGTGTPRPLRSSSGAGGAKPTPTSALQAIEQALGFA